MAQFIFLESSENGRLLEHFITLISKKLINTEKRVSLSNLNFTRYDLVIYGIFSINL